MKIHTQDNRNVIPQGSDLKNINMDVTGDYESEYPDEYFLVHVEEGGELKITTARGTIDTFSFLPGVSPIVLVQKVWSDGSTLRNFVAIY